MTGKLALGPFVMTHDQIIKHVLVFYLPHSLQIHHVKVAQRVEKLHLVEHISNAAAHPRRKIAARLP